MQSQFVKVKKTPLNSEVFVCAFNTYWVLNIAYQTKSNLFNHVQKCLKQWIIMQLMFNRVQLSSKVFDKFMQFLSNALTDISDTLETLPRLALNFDYKRANMVINISTIVKLQSNIHCVTLKFIVIQFCA